MLLKFSHGMSQINYEIIEKFVPLEKVNCIYQDSIGFLWLGTQDRGILRFDGGSFVTFKPDFVCKRIFSDKSQLVFENENSKLLYNGLQFQKSKNSKKQIHNYFGEKELISELKKHKIQEKYWTVVYLKNKNGKRKLYFVRPKNILTGKPFSSFHLEKGKLKESHKKYTKSPFFSEVLLKKHKSIQKIQAISPDSIIFNDNLYFYLFVPKKQFKRIRTPKDVNEWIYNPSNKKVYFSSGNNEIEILSLKSFQFEQSKILENFTTNSERHLFLDNFYNVWVYNDRIFQNLSRSRAFYLSNEQIKWTFELKEKDFLQIQSIFPQKIYKNGKKRFRGLYQTADSILYFSPDGGELKIVNQSIDIQFFKALSDNKILCCTNSRIFIWNWKTRKLKYLYNFPNLKSSNIFVEKPNVFWINSTRITLKNDEIYRVVDYNENSFLTNKFIENCTGNVAGEVFWNTGDKIFKYQFQKESAKSKLPKTVVSKILLFSELPNWSNFTDSIIPFLKIPYSPELNYDENHLTFEFANFDFTKNDGLNFQYKLEGFEEQWSVPNKYNSAIYPNLPPGKYIFKVRSINKNASIGKTFQVSLRILPPFWLTWEFISVVIIAVLLLIFLLFKLRERAIKKRLEEKHQQFIQISQLKLRNLQTQINPHFFYNALTSIKLFAQERQEKEIANQLDTFTLVSRKTLEMSFLENVSVREDTEYLSSFLKFEQLQLDFEFRINFESETGKVKIPSMLTQIFVENSIKHGIRFIYDEIRKIEVNYFLENGNLVCEIIDNGIGLYKSMQKTGSKSFGTNIVKQKIQLFRLLNSGKMNISYQILDLSAKNPSDRGTKVRLEFHEI